MTNSSQHHHSPCPCGKSSDAYSVNPKTGWGKCFRGGCGKTFPPSHLKDTTDITDDLSSRVAPERPKTLTPVTDVFRDFPARALKKNTIERYKVQVIADDTLPIQARYPLFDKDGVHAANKVRWKNKQFTYEGVFKDAGLFGKHAFPAGSAKYVTVFEGQDDAMAGFELLGSRYPCVSVHSSSTAEADIRSDFEYLNSFDNIVICFDNDEPGKEAAKKCSSIGFPLGKLKILTPREFNDANDYLRAGKREEFTKEWWAAPTYKPDGLKMGSEMWDEIINRPSHFQVLYPFPQLNKLTYGIRLSELTVINAPSGVGKTSLLKEIEHELLTNKEIIEKGYGVGFLHLEEPNGDTALGLLSIHNSVPYHLPDVDRPVDDLRRAYDAVLNNGRVVIWDHFGSNSVDAVLDKVRHMAALGCRYIVLDHLSIVVSDQSGDERKQLDEITTKLKTLCMNLNVALIAVIHQNRQGEIRGTAGVEQLANIVLRLERSITDVNEWRRNVTKITVTKNRFSGFTGPASYLFYNSMTGRLTELTKEEVQVYEDGDSLRDDQTPF